MIYSIIEVIFFTIHLKKKKTLKRENSSRNHWYKIFILRLLFNDSYLIMRLLKYSTYKNNNLANKINIDVKSPSKKSVFLLCFVYSILRSNFIRNSEILFPLFFSPEEIKETEKLHNTATASYNFGMDVFSPTSLLFLTVNFLS